MCLPRQQELFTPKIFFHQINSKVDLPPIYANDYAWIYFHIIFSTAATPVCPNW